MYNLSCRYHNLYWCIIYSNDLKQTKTYINKTMKAKHVNDNIKCRKVRNSDTHGTSILILEKCIEELKLER